ncbi:acid-sensing ion channel 1A-like [Ptychodera flava]|uniref:acid-sensing ion channel 1A-like n=1 Tax=Ptychodera flava TaxID=63121 RepID=UPI003969D7AB
MDNLGFETSISIDGQQPNGQFNAYESHHNRHDDNNIANTGVFKTFTQEACLPGIKLIGDTSASFGRRLFWSIIVLLALSGLLHQVITLIMSFMERPINANIKFDEPDTRPEFPAVTICNNNMFRLVNLTKFLGGASVFNFLCPYLYTLFSSDGERIPEFTEFRIPDNESANYGEGQTQLTFMEQSAHSVEDIVRRCSFGGVACGADNFTKIITNYGICYTFNSHKQGYVNQVRNAGQKYGLQLLLYANEREYVAPHTNVGFRLMVHGQDEIPDIANHALAISPGLSTTIGLKTIQVSNLGFPYGHCVEDVKNNLKYFDGAYSLSKCWMECETDYAVEKCGCRYYYMPGNVSFCSPPESQNCYFGAMDEFALKADICNHCEEPCMNTKYDTKMSYDSYPSSVYATLLAFRTKWPCDESLEFYINSRSLQERRGIEADFRTYIDEAYYRTKPNGQNISDFLPDAEFHVLMVTKLVERVFTDIATDLRKELFLHTLAFIIMNETDGLNSEFYNKIKDSLIEKYMNISVRPWIDIKIELRGLFANQNLTSEIADSMITSLFQDYYLPLFEDTFPFIYTKVKDLRDGKITGLLEEGIGEICRNYMQRNLAKVTIYFEDLKINSIIQQPEYHSSNLICDIGGSLGLFFGASMVTFLEIVDFFIVQLCKRGNK